MEEKDKKEAIDAEATNETEVKDNAFKRFWKKTKQSVNDAVLESKIESNYNKEHKAYTIYMYNETFSKSIHGELIDNTLTFFGEIAVKPYSVVIYDATKEAFYVTECHATTVKSIVDGVEYERPGTVITLDRDVTEVKVIKAGKKYYLYKGNE